MGNDASAGTIYPLAGQCGRLEVFEAMLKVNQWIISRSDIMVIAVFVKTRHL